MGDSEAAVSETVALLFECSIHNEDCLKYAMVLALQLVFCSGSQCFPLVAKPPQGKENLNCRGGVRTEQEAKQVTHFVVDLAPDRNTLSDCSAELRPVLEHKGTDRVIQVLEGWQIRLTWHAITKFRTCRV